MKKNLLVVMLVLIFISGCGKKKEQPEITVPTEMETTTTVITQETVATVETMPVLETTEETFKREETTPNEVGTPEATKPSPPVTKPAVESIPSTEAPATTPPSDAPVIAPTISLGNETEWD